MDAMDIPLHKKLYPSELQERDDEYFMKLAYNLAIDAFEVEEVPVGSIIEKDGEIIGSSHNEVERTKDPTAHAEILAITQAARFIGDWRLNDCTLYVTKEPCPMCAGALIQARAKRVVFAVEDSRMGYLGGALDLNATPTNNHKLLVEKGVMEKECRQILRDFFTKKRIEKG